MSAPSSSGLYDGVQIPAIYAATVQNGTKGEKPHSVEPNLVSKREKANSGVSSSTETFSPGLPLKIFTHLFLKFTRRPRNEIKKKRFVFGIIFEF